MKRKTSRTSKKKKINNVDKQRTVFGLSKAIVPSFHGTYLFSFFFSCVASVSLFFCSLILFAFRTCREPGRTRKRKNRCMYRKRTIEERCHCSGREFLVASIFGCVSTSCNKDRFACDKCNFTAQYPSWIREHYKRHHRQKPHTDSFIFFDFATKKKIQKPSIHHQKKKQKKKISFEPTEKL